MKNNYARLKQEADIETVIQHLGLEIHRKGSAFFLACPLPEHSDEHPTNCYFKRGWNNVYCTVCQKSINAIDLIMLIQGVSYGEAADELWELEGRPDWYYAKMSTKSRSLDFSITREEADLIGIHFPGRMIFPFGISDTKPEHSKNTSYLPDSTDNYLLCHVEHCTFRDFATVNQYRCIVRNKADEKRRICAEAMKNCTGELRDGFQKMYEQCTQIIQRCMKNEPS